MTEPKHPKKNWRVLREQVIARIGEEEYARRVQAERDSLKEPYRRPWFGLFRRPRNQGERRG
jgi:hypothetical protein